jgi:hypothetical protein
MSTPPFDRAAAQRRIGPAGIEAVRRLVEEAPPLRAEQREQIRAVFTSTRTTSPGHGRHAQAA